MRRITITFAGIVAKVAAIVGLASISTSCHFIIGQPKEPANLREMLKK